MKKRKTLAPLGETEMEILHHVWDLGSASVADVHQRMLAYRKVAYTTVMTILRKLADKGYLTFSKEGVTYIYSAAKPREEVMGSVLQQMVQKVFRGSPSELVQTLVRQEPLSEAERDGIRRIIDEMEDPDERS